MAENVREALEKIFDNATESCVLGNGYTRYIDQAQALIQKKVDEVLDSDEVMSLLTFAELIERDGAPKWKKIARLTINNFLNLKSKPEVSK